MALTLTYERMVNIINDGGSVLIDGEIITRIEALPLPEDVRGADTDAIKADLLRQKAELDLRLAQMGALPIPMKTQAPVIANMLDPRLIPDSAPENDPTDLLPDTELNPADGYPANHRELVRLVRSKANPWPFQSPNPSRQVLVAWLDAEKVE